MFESKIIAVDIDNNELNKEIIKIDYKVNVDLNYFIDNVNLPVKNNMSWIENVTRGKNGLNIPETIYSKDGINPYYLLDRISNVNNFSTNYICS